MGIFNFFKKRMPLLVVPKEIPISAERTGYIKLTDGETTLEFMPIF